MPMITSPTVSVAHPRSGSLRNVPTAIAFPLAVMAAVVVGTLGTTAIAAIAHAAGISHSFSPLHPGTYIAFIVLGVLGGVFAFGALGIFLGPVLLAVGWMLVLEFARSDVRLEPIPGAALPPSPFIS